MSRIGRTPIQLPSGITVTTTGKVVSIKGPKGSLEVKLHPAVTATVTDHNTVEVTVANPTNITERALWGLHRKLIFNAVSGVHTPFEKKLEFVGVGYRVNVAGNKVTMELGFSHPVAVDLPEGVAASVDKQVLTLTSIDKQLVGEMAAQIRRIRPPEPYKGKGVMYVGEVIRRKAGKAAKAGAAAG